jgi:DNA-binding PadR family transcriptional regulator
MTLDDDFRGHLPLAPHVFQILLSLLEGELHGYALFKDITERTDGEVVLGTSTLYAAVQRLVKEGFLKEADPPAEDESRGPPRKYFRITRAGRALARAEAQRVGRLHRQVARSGLVDALGAVGGGEEGS